MRSLIVNADDFGDSPDVNRAVIRAYREGILRFASLMVLRPAAAEAAALAKENPGLGVGLHLELCANAPKKAGLRYFFSPAARAGLEGEIRAQIETLLKLGVKPTHVDGHINIHVHPVIFPALCRLAREYGIPRVRLPQGELSVNLDYPGDRDPLVPRIIQSGVFGAMGLWIEGAAEGLTVPRTWGLLRSGRMSEDYVLWLIRNLPEGLTEIYFHPSADPSSAVVDAAMPSHQTITELGVLTSPRVKEAIQQAGIDLVSA